MQIDFHHAVTYVSARCAGYAHDEAQIIAHSAQYVDDATNGGLISFENGALYNHIASAHKMLDYNNAKNLANHLVWVPFHFLPGNGGMEAGKNPDGGFIQKLICRPDSHVARDMLRAMALDRTKPYALHRLGISMHVFADTWAHQGFAGVIHICNQADDIKSNMPERDSRIKNKLNGSFIDKLINFFVSNSFPLGHGAVLSHPDQPYLIWKYKNGLGEDIERNNPKDFLQAADYMCRAMQCFRNGDDSMKLEDAGGLKKQDLDAITKIIQEATDTDGDKRHRIWLSAIQAGEFSFGSNNLEYKAKGVGSWKYNAISTEKLIDDDDDKFPYSPSFLSSDWKHFHDALQAHRFDVIHDILPRYGICNA